MDNSGNTTTAGILKELFPGERRVAVVPASIPALRKAGLDVVIESGAGEKAGFPDSEYEEKGATIIPDRAEVFRTSRIILQVQGAGVNNDSSDPDMELLMKNHVLIGFYDPLSVPERVNQLAGKGVTVFSMELIPRITRAQSMDALSSMATVAGYKAVLMAADNLPRMFPMLMTAAGTVAPAKVFVVGAGVAGLQAVATARRLGAVVQAYDVRPAVKEQVESLGAKFVEMELESKSAEDKSGYAKAMDEEFYKKQREMMTRVVAENNVVITTAAVPGKKAPLLITRDMVTGMNPGSVIIDLAAERGGNCELTRPDEKVIENGVIILGPVNLPSTIPYHSSQMYSKNISTFLLHMIHEGKLDPDRKDEIVRETMVTQNGEIVHPKVRELLNMSSKQIERDDA